MAPHLVEDGELGAHRVLHELLEKYLVSIRQHLNIIRHKECGRSIEICFIT
jgi:hypothetical protein